MPLLLEPLTKLFNLILMKGTFPKAWNESFITLIHKKGNKYDNSNYRGISITSNLGKLFNKIIHAWLLKFIGSNNLICENQIGFKENCRTLSTADHIFSLKSLVDHYTAKKKKVFAACIDLRKAFDTVSREGLVYGLLQHHLPYKLFNIIYSMYHETKCRIKFQNGISHTFTSTCEVKQGNVLRPISFQFVY